MAKTRRRRPASMTFPEVIRSFAGYLEGTQKSLHTIKNYQSDLVTFREFFEGKKGSKKGSEAGQPLRLTAKDLEKYSEHLRALGLRTNTRRRKLLTVRKLLRFLTKRGKFENPLEGRLPAPEKVERVPETVPYPLLIEKIRGLPLDGAGLSSRNRALLWVLAETGISVSEVSSLSWDSQVSGGLKVGGKNPRTAPLSRDLEAALRELEAEAKSKWIFPGHNKHGPLGGPITPRGVELLVRAYAARLGFPDLVPRTFRHSAVVQWHRDGLRRDEIRARLGLRTDYAFRVYDRIFKGLERESNAV